MRRWNGRNGWRFRVEQHELGPRVYFLGLRWHDWHLGLIVLGALAVAVLSGFVHLGFSAFFVALAGLWLIAKDWRDLTSHRRDTAAWRLGLHRHPAPLRVFRRADPLPVIAALGSAAIALAQLNAALSPTAHWRGHLLTNARVMRQLHVFHELAIPAAAVLLICAYYLLRRRRRALYLAIALLVALSIFNLLRGLAVEEAIGYFVVAGVLWWGRSSFYVKHEPIGRRAALLRAPLVVLAGFLLSLAVVTIAAPDASAVTLVRETGDLLLWQTGPLSFHDEFGRLDLAVGLLGVVTLSAAAYLVFRPLAAPRDLPDPRARLLARELVREHGSDTLAYFKLRTDKHYLFSDDRRAFVGYRVEGGVLVISGDPVGPEQALPKLLAKVAAFAEQRGLRIAAVGVSTKARPLFTQLGLHGLYLGDEAIVETRSFSLDGRAIRKVRQSVSRLEKAGYSCVSSPIGDLPAEEVDGAMEAATRWLGEAQERGFSMALDAGLAEHGDTFVVLAHDADGRLRGLLHLVPTAKRRGLSLSMMRRDPEAPNGLTEYMIVKTVETFREQGIDEISLNFAAFARLLHSPEGVAERLLRRGLQLADSFFQIERLYRFNEKFNPRWEARYLMHEGALSLPRAALATMWLEGHLPRPHLPRRGRPSRT
jgi:lysyl-tRNA synthetase, class II